METWLVWRTPGRSSQIGQGCRGLGFKAYVGFRVPCLTPENCLALASHSKFRSWGLWVGSWNRTYVRMIYGLHTDYDFASHFGVLFLISCLWRRMKP